MEDPRDPVGRFEKPASITLEERQRFITAIEETPAKLRQAVAAMMDEQLDAPYRSGGWTKRQVVHHLADSHINAYVRFRLALTEDQPTIKPYDEARWAELPDAAREPIEVSLRLLDSLHARWVVLMRAMKPEDWARTFVHPDRGVMNLDVVVAMYAWHGFHHVAHVRLKT